MGAEKGWKRESIEVVVGEKERKLKAAFERRKCEGKSEEGEKKQQRMKKGGKEMEEKEEHSC